MQVVRSKIARNTSFWPAGDTVHLLHVVPHRQLSYSRSFTVQDDHQPEFMVRQHTVQISSVHMRMLRDPLFATLKIDLGERKSHGDAEI